VDARREPDGKSWRVFTHGGRNPTELNAISWARQAVELGAGEILLTSMDRDGTKIGYDCELTRGVSDAVSVPVIASGGAGVLSHFADALIEGHASAVLAASLFHFGTLTMSQVKDHLAARNIAVRR
jgi:cyclase